VARFGDALAAMGTPRFSEFLEDALANGQPAMMDAYIAAYIEGVTAALLISGVVGIVGAVLAWVLTGRRDPLRTVFDLRDERSAPRPAGGVERDPDPA
jgi:hypothetical protein